MRSWSIVLLGLLLAGQPAKRPGLPPLSYTCPMDPDIIEETPGVCPRCRMPLEPVRLDRAYSCPVHTSVIEAAAGACRICRRDLVPITVSLFFTCGGRPAVRELGPGTCDDGSPRTAVRERRVHGDHNPRHGGQFFMAADNWHHLEGTYPAGGVFRVYVYDDFTRPLPAPRLRDIRGRAFVSDPDGRPAAGRADPVPLTVAKNGRALEARLGAGLPARISLRLAFAAGGTEQRFDFAFAAYTSEPEPGGRPATPASSPATVSSPPSPETTPDINALVEDLAKQRSAVDTAVREGAYGSIYIPALAAKDAALQLEALAGAFPEPRRVRISAAVKRIVVAAWLLDLYGDLGDRQHIEEAHRAFGHGVDDLTAAYAK